MRKLLVPIFLLAATSVLANDHPGAALYLNKGKCALCHAKDGSGNTPTGKAMKARDLRSAEVQQQSDAELVTVITEGRGKMPGYKASLSADEIQTLVSYIRALSKP